MQEGEDLPTNDTVNTNNARRRTALLRVIVAYCRGSVASFKVLVGLNFGPMVQPRLVRTVLRYIPRQSDMPESLTDILDCRGVYLISSAYVASCPAS